MDKSELSGLLREFALDERVSSPLYRHLASNVAKDDDLLDITLHARSEQPVPNILFSAVQYLLFQGKKHPLRDYFPSLASSPKRSDQSFPFFREFCLENRDELISLLQTKIVQTNEVRRCSYLYPAFCYIYEKTKKPLSLIELGTSAGMLLLWDCYRYDYGLKQKYGDQTSDVQIKAEIRGGGRPPLLLKSPPVSSRVGLDLHVNNLTIESDTLWLKALIWPEHKERFILFEKAVQSVREHPLHLIEGDGITLIPKLAEDTPEDTTLCIFHTHVANQLPEEAKLMLVDHINKIGKNRDVFHLYNNMWDGKLHLDYWINGRSINNIVGSTDWHGKWFTWNL